MVEVIWVVEDMVKAVLFRQPESEDEIQYGARTLIAMFDSNANFLSPLMGPCFLPKVIRCFSCT